MNSLFSIARFSLVLGALALGSAHAAEKTTDPVVTLTPTVATTDESGAKPGIVTVTRTGDLTAPLTVTLEFSGSAKAGVDFREIPKSLVLPAGEATGVITVIGRGDFEKEPARTVVVHLRSDDHYALGSTKSATVTINDAPPELFVAALRPTAEAPESTAYGTAVLLLAPDHSRARVTVDHANLSSPLVASHLKLGDPGREGAYLIKIPAGQRVTFDWAMQPSGTFTSEALQAALDQGKIYAALDTKNHSTGELRGNFIHATGSTKFQAPPAPPKQPNTPPTARDVARFLTQATFGPTKTDIDEFINPTPRPNQPKPRPQTFAAWISEQMAIPASSHLEVMRADYRAFPPTNPRPRITNGNRMVAWWQLATNAPDQLRQRVAFALSEIFVVSDVNDALANNAEAAAAYYDMLARDAFGNFRVLLEDVTLRGRNVDSEMNRKLREHSAVINKKHLTSI